MHVIAALSIHPIPGQTNLLFGLSFCHFMTQKPQCSIAFDGLKWSELPQTLSWNIDIVFSWKHVPLKDLVLFYMIEYVNG